MENIVFRKKEALVTPKSSANYEFHQPNKYIQLVRRKLDSPTSTLTNYPRHSSSEVQKTVSKKAPNPRPLLQHSVSAYPYHREGNILSEDQFEAIWLFLPVRYQIGQFVLAFSTAEHGISIRTFLDKLRPFPASMIVVRTTKQEIFGAFCSEDWSKRNNSRKELSFFGTGESFLFTCHPRTRIYPWVGWTSKIGEEPSQYSSLFMAACSHTIVIGGGGGGSGIRFNSDLSRGRSETCSTFDNQALCSGGDFFTSAVEVYGLMP